MIQPLPRLGALFALALLISPAVQAEQFIGFAQPGLPGRWAVESFPVVNRNVDGDTRASSNTVLAYFSETGFTDTTRDQLQFWVGAVPGYAETQGDTDASAWGLATPNLGFAYYYNVVPSTGTYGASDYRTFWTNPSISIELPSGNQNLSGHGAFTNRYAASFSVANYVQIGRFGATFTPFGVHYAARNRNSTDFGGGDPRQLRGGLSYWFGDIAAGYLVTDDLWLGVHHIYNVNNRAASDFKTSRVGKVGPSMTYNGFARQGVYLSANFNVDYYHSANLRRSNELTMALLKFF